MMDPNPQLETGDEQRTASYADGPSNPKIGKRVARVAGYTLLCIVILDVSRSLLGRIVSKVTTNLIVVCVFIAAFVIFIAVSLRKEANLKQGRGSDDNA